MKNSTVLGATWRIASRSIQLFADRVSTETKRPISAACTVPMTYVLSERLRRVGLKGTELAEAQYRRSVRSCKNRARRSGVTVRKVWSRCLQLSLQNLRTVLATALLKIEHLKLNQHLK